MISLEPIRISFQLLSLEYYNISLVSYDIHKINHWQFIVWCSYRTFSCFEHTISLSLVYIFHFLFNYFIHKLTVTRFLDSQSYNIVYGRYISHHCVYFQKTVIWHRHFFNMLIVCSMTFTLEIENLYLQSQINSFFLPQKYSLNQKKQSQLNTADAYCPNIFP